MAVQMLGIKTKFTDDQGRPLVGGKVHAYFAGTTTYQDTFKDPDMTIVNTNPIILDDSGSADVYLNGSYRIRIFDKNDVLIEEQDGVTQSASGEITTAKGEIIGLYGAVLNSLTNEVKRAVAAEKTISDSLTSETTRAKSAESALQSSIDAEAVRAKAAESDLNADIIKEVSDRESEVARLDEADAVLQAQINSVGGGKLAYKTYAEMIADKSNIAAKSSIDILADTDDKNGTYLYDGTDFVKSQYDIEKIIRAKVQNTFGTYAQMVASNLSDGSYALVADDTDDKNGIYIKESGTWVESKYDLALLASKKTEESYKSSRSNHLTVTYKKGLVSSFDTTTSSGGVVTNSSIVRYALISVEPSTTYYIAKKGGSGFFVYEYSTMPETGSGVSAVGSLVDVPSMGFGLKVDAFGNLHRGYHVTTGASTRYIIVSGTDVNNVNSEFIVQVTEGESVSPMVSANRYVGNTVADGVTVSNPNDNLFKGDILNGALHPTSGSPDSEAKFDPVQRGFTTVTRVKEGRKYLLTVPDLHKYDIFASSTGLDPDNANVLWIEGRYIHKRNDFSVGDSEVEFSTLRGERFVYVVMRVSIKDEIPAYLNIIDIGSAIGESKNNALHYEIDREGVYISARNNAPHAHDDTQDLQRLFDLGGVINLDGSKIYSLSSTLTLDLSKVKQLNGNGATLVSTHDGVALEITSNNTKTAAPSGRTHEGMLSADRWVKGLRITSDTGFRGTGVFITKTFRLDLDIAVYFMAKGIELGGLNRNLRLRPKIYQITQDALLFNSTCNLHQCQVYNADISYTDRAIVADDAELYNVQFLGGDIESSFVRKSGVPDDAPSTELNRPRSLIHLRADRRKLFDIGFYNLTLEDHVTNTEPLVIIDSVPENAKYIRFIDCYFGHTAADNFRVGCVEYLTITGIAKQSWKGAFVTLTNDCSWVNIDVVTDDAGVLLKAEGDFTARGVTLKGVCRQVNKSVVDMNCNVRGFSMCGGNYTMGVVRAEVPFVRLGGEGKTVDMVQISNNLFDTSVSVFDAIQLNGTAQRCTISGNIVSRNAQFPENSGSIMSFNNYAG